MTSDGGYPTGRNPQEMHDRACRYSGLPGSESADAYDCCCSPVRNPQPPALGGHMPEVLCNEDNVFFVVGGFSHDAARIALALHLRDCEGLSAEDAYVWANDVLVETRWLKWADGPDPEQMVVAAESDPAAELFTVMAATDA